MQLNPMLNSYEPRNTRCDASRTVHLDGTDERHIVPYRVVTGELFTLRSAWVLSALIG